MTVKGGSTRATTLLDHGHIRLIETWGCDEQIIQAARQSTDKGFIGWGPLKCPTCDGGSLLKRTACQTCKGKGIVPGDEKLLTYLYTHKHATPFEFAGAIVEIQAPIAVFREWQRHRTQSYSEMSARYTIVPNVNYVPSVERLLMDGGSNRQAQAAGGVIDVAGAEDFRSALQQHYEAADALYRLSSGAAGVPKELARLCMPVGRYSHMWAQANLRNWLGFLTLRTAPNAQWEIRQYADALLTLLAEQFPRTIGLWKAHGTL